MLADQYYFNIDFGKQKKLWSTSIFQIQERNAQKPVRGNHLGQDGTFKEIQCLNIEMMIIRILNKRKSKLFASALLGKFSAEKEFI